MKPQELMDIEGAGNANKEVKKIGKWDDSLILDGVTKFEFKFDVFGWYKPSMETKTVKVIASSKNEAEDIAVDMVDFDEIDDVVFSEIKEVEQ